MPRPAKNRLGVTISTEEKPEDLLMTIRDKIPELRGKSPSALSSIALLKLYEDSKNNPDDVKKFVVEKDIKRLFPDMVSGLKAMVSG